MSSLQFLPDPDLKALMTKQNVEAILSEHKSELYDPESVNELTLFVVKHAYRIFAALVMVGKPSLIETFRENDFRQDMLPVICYSRKDGQVEVKPINGVDCEGKAGKTFSQPPWQPNEIEVFCHPRQWSFMSPTFKNDKFRYVFGAYVVLPFTRHSDESKTKRGGYGIVQEKSIHKGHMELPPNHVRTPWRRIIGHVC